MKSLWILLAVLVSFVNSQKSDDFQVWKKKYGKSYNTPDSIKAEAEAEKTFNKNAASVAKHNSDKTATYKQELNAEADLTPEELIKYRQGYFPKKDGSDTNEADNTESTKKQNNEQPNEDRSTSSKPSSGSRSPRSVMNSATSLDYTSQMSPIKNQNQCGKLKSFSLQCDI